MMVLAGWLGGAAILVIMYAALWIRGGSRLDSNAAALAASIAGALILGTVLFW
jgi:hypothetical protein